MPKPNQFSRLAIPALCCALLLASSALGVAADFPGADITNGQIKAHLYLPDRNNGFYRSTRFDWSGVISRLDYKGHVFYGPWFQKIDPAVYDFGYDDHGVVSAPFTAMIGPGEEFNTDGAGLGFAEAKPGGTFIKIGVGVLRKPMPGEPPVPAGPANLPGRNGSAPDPDRYDHSRTYRIVDPGKWTVKKTRDSVEFTQVLNDDADGYGYVYSKSVRLVSGKPAMRIEHSLKNTGRNPIHSTVYDHNFFVLDNQGPSEGLTIAVPFRIQTPRPPTAGLLEVRGNQLVYVKTLEDQDRATATIRGFGETAKDYDIRVENKRLAAGYHVIGDRPLSNLVVWSIRTVNAVEPYIAMSIEPGQEFTWTLAYDYYTIPAGK